MAIVVRNVRRGLIWDKVQFQATCYEEARFGSLFGDKMFWMEKGDYVTLRMPKDDMWEIGEEARSLSCLVTGRNQDKFNWYWA